MGPTRLRAEGFDSGCRYSNKEITRLRALTQWIPIADHPHHENECLLGILKDGAVELADRGGWEKGGTREEWDEVEDGVMIRLYEDEEEGLWWSNYGVIEEPTHYQEIIPAPPEGEA